MLYLEAFDSEQQPHRLFLLHLLILKVINEVYRLLMKFKGCELAVKLMNDLKGDLLMV